MDRFAGLITVADAHAAEVSLDKPVDELLRYREELLLPSMSVKEAVLAFDHAEAEALAVVDSFLDRRVVGLLIESTVLRRYSTALEQRRQDIVGEI
jgi:CIC family chloride channel protein